jgi:hypothetical protein
MENILGNGVLTWDHTPRRVRLSSIRTRPNNVYSLTGLTERSPWATARSCPYEDDSKPIYVSSKIYRLWLEKKQSCKTCKALLTFR